MSLEHFREHLEKLPEPVLRALVDVVVAAAGLDQLQKRQATVALQQTAKNGGLLGPLLGAVSAVVDELHTVTEPRQIRRHVLEDKVAQRREADRLMSDVDVAALMDAIRRRTEEDT